MGKIMYDCPVTIQVRRVKFQSSRKPTRCPELAGKEKREVFKSVVRYPSFSAVTCKIPSHVVKKKPASKTNSKFTRIKQYPSYKNVKHRIDDENPTSRPLAKRARTEFVRLPSFSNVNSTIPARICKNNASLLAKTSDNTAYPTPITSTRARALTPSIVVDNDDFLAIKSKSLEEDDVTLSNDTSNENVFRRIGSRYKSTSDVSTTCICDESDCEQKNKSTSTSSSDKKTSSPNSRKSKQHCFWLPTVQRKRIRQVFKGGSKLITIPFSLFVY